MNIDRLLTDIAANVAAGFAEEVASALHAEAAEIHSNPHARNLGNQIASELLGRTHEPPPVSAELFDTEGVPIVPQGRVIQVSPLRVTERKIP